MNFKQSGRNVVIFDYFKVQVRDRKALGDWTIKVLRTLCHCKIGDLELETTKFDMESLPESFPSISDDGLDNIIEQLKDIIQYVFEKVNENVREFISPILANAVSQVCKKPQ